MTDDGGKDTRGQGVPVSGGLEGGQREAGCGQDWGPPRGPPRGPCRGWHINKDVEALFKLGTVLGTDGGIRRRSCTVRRCPGRAAKWKEQFQPEHEAWLEAGDEEERGCISQAEEQNGLEAGRGSEGPTETLRFPVCMTNG